MPIECTRSCMSRGCNCDAGKPAVALYAESLDAVGSAGCKVSLPSLIRSGPVGKDPPGYVTRSERRKHMESSTFDLGSRKQGEHPIGLEMTVVQLTPNHYTIEVLASDVPSGLQAQEVEAILSELRTRLDKMLRDALMRGSSV